MDLECIMLSEISQRKKNTVRCHFYVESKEKTELTDTENRLAIAKCGEAGAGQGGAGRGGGGGWKGWRGQKVQTFSYTINKSGDVMYRLATTVNTVLHI